MIFTLMPFEQMIYQYLGEKKEGGKKKPKKKEPKATVTATFPLSEPFVSGFSWKRCLSKQLLSCTAASPPGMHGEHGSWRDHNNPCGLGCHGRHNGELCGGTAGAKHDSPLHSQPRTRQLLFHSYNGQTHILRSSRSLLARSLTSMTATARSKAMQPLKKQSNPKVLKLHRLAGILHKNKPATVQDNERPENQ